MASDIPHPSTPGRLLAAPAGAARSQLVLGLILAALCIAISIAAPQFYSEANIIAILRQCALVLIVACGMTMLIITAEVDLSVGASLAFVGCVGMAVLNRDAQPGARHAGRPGLRRRASAWSTGWSSRASRSIR